MSSIITRRTLLAGAAASTLPLAGARAQAPFGVGFI